MPLPRVGIADPQRRHRPAAEHGRRVDRLAGGDPGEPPPGAGAQVSWPLGHHDQVGAEHVPRRQQPAVQRDRLQVATERLAHRHGGRQPASVPQRGGGAGEPCGQRGPIQHDVDGSVRSEPAIAPVPGENRGQGRVQVGHHDRDAVQVVRVAQDLVVRGALLVGAEDGGLQRRVSRLDQVAGAVPIRRQPVRQRDHQRVPAGSQAQMQRTGIEQHPVPRLRPAGELRVGERPDRCAVDGHLGLDRAGPLPPQGGHHPAAPPDHEGRVVDARSRQGGGRAFKAGWWTRVQGRVVDARSRQGGGRAFKAGWWTRVQGRVVDAGSSWVVTGWTGNRASASPERRGRVRSVPGGTRPGSASAGRAGRAGEADIGKNARMSRRKTERLLSLVVCLLSAGKYLTASQIRDAVPGYPESFDAFKRMFERDKDELRELGIPLETGVSATADEEPGYRIPRQEYGLPEIRLEPDEAAVLGLAARVWRRAELAGAAAGALLKLRAAGIDADPKGPDGGDEHSPVPEGIEPRLSAPEPAFGPLWEAVRDRRPVTFSYRAAGRSEPQRRELEPWGVVNRHGRWYVAGWDRGRDAIRVFRLGRIAGPVKFCGPPGSVTVPDGADVRELVRDWDSAPAREHTAVLRVRSGTGVGLRQHAVSVNADETGPPGWDLVTTRFADVGSFADYAASFGPDAVVLDPPDLREAVIARLKGVLA